MWALFCVTGLQWYNEQYEHISECKWSLHSYDILSLIFQFSPSLSFNLTTSYYPSPKMNPLSLNHTSLLAKSSHSHKFVCLSEHLSEFQPLSWDPGKSLQSLKGGIQNVLPLPWVKKVVMLFTILHYCCTVKLRWFVFQDSNSNSKLIFHINSVLHTYISPYNAHFMLQAW